MTKVLLGSDCALAMEFLPEGRGLVVPISFVVRILDPLGNIAVYAEPPNRAEMKKKVNRKLRLER